MIVKVCDSCQKLLDSDCAFVAIREHGMVAFKRGADAKGNNQSHFCGAVCMVEFLKNWAQGNLPEPAPLPEVPVVAHVTSDPQGVPPPAERIAEQNALLASVLGSNR